MSSTLNTPSPNTPAVNTSSFRRGCMFALLATVIWSGNFIIARGLANDIPPVTLAMARWTTATLALLPFGLRPFLKQWPEVRANLRMILITALLGVTVFNTLIYIAGHSTTALNLSLIAVFTPVFIIVLARIFLKETITRTGMLGTALAVAGVVTLTTGGEFSRLADLTLNPGDGWMLLAGLIFAAYTILVRRRPPELHPTTYLFATFLFGVIMILPWAAWEWTTTPPAVPALHVAGSILYIGVGASLLSYLFWNKAVAAIGPSRAGMIYYSLPVFCAIEAWLILGEKITVMHVLSGAMIITGIFLASRR